MRAVISATIMLATILQALDSTIAAVALPDMQGTFSATQDQVAWVLTSYIVASAIMTPMAGYLGDRLGRKNLYLISVAGFIITSMVCGLATSHRGDGAIPLPAGLLRRAARTVSAGNDARHFSTEPDRPRNGDVRHGRDAGANTRAKPRRVSDRVLQLALGVFHQRTARRARADRHSGGDQGSGAPRARPAVRPRRICIAQHCDRVAAVDARSRQLAVVVSVERNRHRRHGCGDLLLHVHRARDDEEPAADRTEDVQGPQLQRRA